MAGTALAWDLIARDGASPTFNRVAASADKAAAATARAEKGILGFSKKAVAGLGALVSIDFAAHAVKDAAEFQSAMTRIQTVVGASKAEVDSMSKALLALAPSVATGPNELAVSLYHMEAIGLRGAAALDAVKVAAEGAKIGNADLEDTTNALTATIQSGIAGNQSFAATMAQLLTIVGSGDMKLQDFNEALSSGLLATMANAGVSLRDVGAALAVLGDNNVRGANSATMLRVAVQALQAPAKAGAQALDSIGINAGELQKDLLHGGLNAAISDLNDHLVASGNSGKRAGALLVEAFGKRANTGIGVLIKKFDLLQTKYGIIDKNTNNFGDKWTETTKTATFALDKLKAEFEVVAITVGTKLIPPVTAFVNFLTGDLGPALVTPWHALEDVLSVVGAGLSAIGSVLSALHLPLGGITVAALGAYAAFKLFSAIPGVISTVLYEMQFKLLQVSEAFTGAGATATVAGAEIAESGVVARVGWAGILGPLGAAAVGVGLLVSAFHHSSAASVEAAAAAKAYTDALAGGEQGGTRTTILDAIRQQLIDNQVPEKVDALNKALGRTAYSGSEFVTAIQQGNPALQALQDRLEKTAAAQRKLTAYSNQPPDVVNNAMANAKIAETLISDLNSQYGALSKAIVKDLTDTKAFSGVSASIDKVSASTVVGSDTAKKYAEMMGIVVDKNGVAAVSAKTLNEAVNTVRFAFNGATQTGSEFLSALSTFSTSTATASDRAAIIGSTLKAANGDALNYAAGMNTASSANRTFAKDIRQAAKTAKESTHDYLAGVVNLKTGTINYNKQAAGPLIQDLQAIQSAGMAAASATFQHARATMNGTRAADAAYKVYRSQTHRQLVDEFTNLTGNAKAAQRLADKYLGMPKKVKTLIEQEGANPIVDVLNHIGRLLAVLVGKPWKPKVEVDPGDSLSTVDGIAAHLSRLHDKTVTVTTDLVTKGTARAGGGMVYGPGTSTSDSIPARLSNGEYVVNAKATSRNRGLLEAINSGGYARGGAVGTVAHSTAGPQRIRGELTISEDSQGRLRAWVEGVVEDHADMHATIGRMHRR